MQPVTSVSIVIPVRNGAAHIAEAIGSALDQGAPVEEVVVVDDGSTDATLEIVRAFADPKIRVLERCPDGAAGVSTARNRGLAVARGGWVLFLDADDRLRPDAVAALAAAAGDAVAVYADYDRIDGSGRPIGRRAIIRGRHKPSGHVLERLLAENFIVVGCVLIHTVTLRSLGGFAESLRYCEDWHAWCRLATRGPIRYLPRAHVVDYRVHASSTTMNRSASLESYLPALNAIFADPLISAEVLPERMARLRRRAEMHLRRYLLAQALRNGRYGTAIVRLADALWRDPARAPRTLAVSAAVLAGI